MRQRRRSCSEARNRCSPLVAQCFSLPDRTRGKWPYLFLVSLYMYVRCIPLPRLHGRWEERWQQMQSDRVQ